MSAIDAIFVFFYLCCGIALGAVLAKHVGPVYGIIGFIVGFVLPMVLWRFIARRIGSRRNKKPASEAGKVDGQKQD
jgi:Flp pilus assembly protein TadB